METAEILQALPRLTVEQRLTIAEAALRLVHEEQHLTREQRRQQMAIAALGAIADYAPGTELTAFTVLDGENFYDQPTADSDHAHA